MIKKSGLEEAMNEQTFETFVTETPLQKKIKEKAYEYRSVFLDRTDYKHKPWFYIGGNPGSGKTHICTAICGDLLRNNVEVVYMQWTGEARRLKAFINEPDFESLVDRYTYCSVLYIDDLFKQAYHAAPSLSDADIRMAFTIINMRYLQNKPTIISSEWSLESLLEVDEGVFSRVYERSRGFTITIPRSMEYNYRLAKRKNES